MRALRLVLALVVLAGGLFIGARPVGPAPALGAFLEPAHGVWSLARSAVLRGDASATLPGLGARVRVVYDDRAVPHIFARSEADAYRALGYVVARDRLFQLYVQTLAASGRLTELGGAAALDLDREMRRLGLPRAAERRMAAASDTSEMTRFTRAYADGVNAYIDAMPAAELPLELRLLGKRPPKWSPIDSYLMLERMGWTLANIALERDRAVAAALVGSAAAAELFPDDSPIQEPIQPNGQHAPRFDTRPLPPPGAPDSASAVVASATDAWLPSRQLARSPGDEDPARWMASNNWAVSPARTANAHALLAGDPHLDLSLPSLWYEAHLVVPGTLDVYGVTIPGAPGIVIGFNRDVAWTFTNTGTDVMDFYAETVDDDAHPTRYRLDGAWRTLERRVEPYRGRTGETIAADTIYYSHRGPLQRVRGRWLSMRWTVLEDGRELGGFIDGAHARTAAEFENAMAGSYRAPAQNMLAADRGGHITIRSTGRYPIRPGDGSGSRLFDGSTSASDWTGDVPVAQWPQAFDPAQGFVASANQQPIDPSTTKVWFGGSYDPWRALRINALLRADSVVTVDDMRRFQTDPGSARADYFVPYLISAGKRIAARGTAPNPRVLDDAVRALARWDRRYTLANTGAVLYEAAMREVAMQTWDELAPSHGGRRLTPSSAVLSRLMADSSSRWWDDRDTPAVEGRDAILASAISTAFLATRQRYGPPDGGGWTWSRVHHANIHHLLRLPALSALDLPVTGGPATLSPIAGSGTHGPSWRMVVDLGPTVHAWVTYPGGQSGNPASARYRDRISQWVNGQLEAVHVPAVPEELNDAQRTATLLLQPKP
ncbi:MAG TPA: penicillin acylase family protein [Gemmatimonadaceae bacterium]|jgi:penicillin amidase|nr:penicillin acylase family protein [Gemmatimonadaceae bacterium]